MKLTKLILVFAFLFSLALAASFASATVTVNYNISSAIIEDDASLNTTGSALLNGVNVNVEGYACANAGCTAIVPGAIPGLVSSTSNGIMTVVYPNNLTTPFGYVLYFYADEYIGWEQFSNWSSPDGNNYNVNSSRVIYLSKKRSGYAPIMDLSVEETVPTNRPIEVNASVSIDAETYSAITENTTSDIALNEEVETLVTLEITNSTGAVIYTASQTVSIPYSNSADVTFAYAGFISTGNYNIKLSTNVTDAKILRSIEMESDADITVIPDGLLNYSYSEISNLAYNPALPRQNDSVAFSFDYFSIFVNETGAEIPINTTINISIFRDSSLVYNNVFNTTYNGSYSFSRTFAEAGNYNIAVIGTPTAHQGNQTILQSASVSFVIGSAIAGDDDDDTDDDDDDDDDGDEPEEEENEIIIISPRPASTNATQAIELGKKKSEVSLSRKLILGLIILIILLIAAIALTAAVKFGA